MQKTQNDDGKELTFSRAILTRRESGKRAGHMREDLDKRLESRSCQRLTLVRMMMMMMMMMMILILILMLMEKYEINALEINSGSDGDGGV
jgi:preprotein translocase subunit SecG